MFASDGVTALDQHTGRFWDMSAKAMIETAADKTKLYRVVCSGSDGLCDIHGSLYASKEEAYVVALLKQVTIVRSISQLYNELDVREACLNALEEVKDKPIEEQHRVLCKFCNGRCLKTFNVEHVSLSFFDLLNLIDMAISMVTNSEQKVYVVKSTIAHFAARHHHHGGVCSSYECFEYVDDRNKRRMVLHGAFLDSREAYMMALKKQAHEVLVHCRHVAYKGPFIELCSQLEEEEEKEPKKAFESLKSWLLDERVNLESFARSFTVQEFVVKSFLDKPNSKDWKEVQALFEAWDKQSSPKESVNLWH
ncbi:hypothetical protein L7F22_061250 [Adiantum nelumboides]|nr:hypothetical protein [Adiantum nelumboides]